MALLQFLFTALTLCGVFVETVSAKYAFAHMVMGNTYSHTSATWANDITLARNAGIDAFVLNCGHGDPTVTKQIPIAFAAAEAAGSSFKLFFAFDYLGGGSVWPASEVIGLLNQYKTSPAYFKYNGSPMVSTFEGTGNIGDWAQGGTIRSAVGNLHFVPDWTSLGTGGISPYLNNIDGFFSWDMWPNGATSKTDQSDLNWKTATPGKTFMMGVSPWFFHSPTGGKDWVWRGDNLWSDRWAQTLEVQPDFVQIVTWNDFGEAHYIGPIYSDSEIPQGSAIYVDNFPHESWRDFLPYYIAKYKGNTFDISRDQMQYWYHTAPVAGGSTCGVVGNNADQGQTEVSPNDIVQDAVFFSALLTSDATVVVQIGNNAAVSYRGVAGINHWSQPFNGQTGVPTFSVVRNGATVGSSTRGSGTPAITSSTTLSNGCTNYNAWVGSW